MIKHRPGLHQLGNRPPDGQRGAIYQVGFEQIVMVDAGTDTADNMFFIEREMATIGRHPSELCAVFLTHGHGDHSGGAKALQETYDIPVYVGKGDQQAVESGNYWLTAGFHYGRFFDPVHDTLPIGNGYERWLAGVMLRANEVPGHTPGSIAYELEFEDGDKIGLFGDALWGGHHSAIGSDIAAGKQSIETMLLHNLTGLSFGHGINRIVRNVRPHLELFLQQIETCHNSYDHIPQEYFNIVRALRTYVPEALVHPMVNGLWRPAPACGHVALLTP